MRYKVFTLIFLVFFIFVPSASAHVLRVDGSIGVTVHIDPDDAPVSGEKNTIFVSIKDKDKRFDEKNPTGCDCILEIVKDGNVRKTLPVTTGSTYNSLQYDFPESGTYQLRVVGNPNGKGTDFQPFSTSVEYYVKSESPTTIDKQNPLLLYYPYLLLFGGGIILFLFLNPFKKRE